jgi:hypothetical protein
MNHARAVLIALGSLGFFAALSATGAEVAVLHPQGSAHGFVEVVTLEGKRLAVGDLRQRLKGTVVTSRLTLHFFDGSLDDETTVYSQRGVFRFISDHHVQRGPSFPNPTDATIDARRGTVMTRDAHGAMTTAHLDMPPDVYNGLASTLLMNVDPAAPETRIAIVIALAKPRLAHLSMKRGGEVKFTLGGTPRVATEFVVHVELDGVAGVVAPLIGKEPLDYRVLILTGADPAFIREEGQLYVGGPVWRIQQISAVLSDEHRRPP